MGFYDNMENLEFFLVIADVGFTLYLSIQIDQKLVDLVISLTVIYLDPDLAGF